MFIKGIDKRGNAIRHQPADCVGQAVLYGLKKKSTPGTLYWLQPGSVQISGGESSPKGTEGEFEATYHGTCLVGRTDVKTDRFYEAKPHTFEVGFASAKDEIGAPDIAVTGFRCEAAETNPSRNVGHVDRTNVAKPAPMGELKPQITNSLMSEKTDAVATEKQTAKTGKKR